MPTSGRMNLQMWLRVEMWMRLLPHGRSSNWHVAGVSLLCTGVAIAVRFLINPLVGDNLPFDTFFPALLIASLWAGGWAGAGVLALGSAAVAYFWLEPAWSLDLTPASLAATVVFWIFGGALVWIAIALRTMVGEITAAQSQAELMAHEMKHRAGNLIGVIQAISRQTARNATSIADYQSRLEERLLALSRAQIFAGTSESEALVLDRFLAAALEPFGRDRFTFAGPPAALPSTLAASLGLLLHELGTNAMKYGALSVSGGQVLIEWSVEKGRVAMEWRETGGPPVVAPERTGFGTKLVKMVFPPQAGQAAIAYETTGVRCAVAFPDARTPKPTLSGPSAKKSA